MSLPGVLLLGFGRMGAALAEGWCEQGLAPSYAVDPQPAAPRAGVVQVATLADVPVGFSPEAVILAVKPQVADAVVPGLRRYVPGAVFLSIMAGKTLGTLAGLLGDRAAVVRAMPNTPAEIRQGISVACAGAGVSAAQRGLCDGLLAAAGSVFWTEREGDLDAVTAVSGGGPAYVFLLAELLQAAGEAEGLPAALARALARQTITGAGALLAHDPVDAEVLRRNVTSPGGTTERALAVLLEDWPQSVRRAVQQAAARSRDLS